MWFPSISTILVLQAIWAVTAIYLTRKWLRHMSYLNNESIRFSRDFHAFSRNDYPFWPKTSMYLSAIFLAPWRLLIILLVLVIADLCIRILQKLFRLKSLSDSHPQFRKLGSQVIKKGCWVIGKCVGMTHTYKLIRAEASNHPQVRLRPEGKTAPIAICNHSSWTDFVFLLSQRDLGFVAKDGLQNVPLVGTFGRFMQSIFVRRESKSDRNAALQGIFDRLEALKKGGIFNQLLVFPEGTTTNNKFVIGFKKGAFVGDSVKVFGLRYTGPISISIASISEIDTIIAALLNIRLRIEWFEIEGVVENHKGLEPELFAEEVRKIYIKEFGFEPSDNNFRDREKFESPFLSPILSTPVAKDK